MEFPAPFPTPPPAPSASPLGDRLTRIAAHLTSGGPGPAWTGWPASRRARVVATLTWSVTLAAAFTLALAHLTGLEPTGMPAGPTGDAIIASLLLTAPLLALRRSPLLALRAMNLGLAWIVFCSTWRPLWPWPTSSLIVYGIVAVLAARTVPPSRLVGAWTWTMAALWISGRGAQFGALVALGAAMALLLAVGAALGDRTAARQAAATASAQRDAESERLAVLAERTRIARELHDIVAHHMAMIAIQAQAAPLRSPGLPPETVESFGLIEQAAREALTQTRGVVGLLRAGAPSFGSPETGPSDPLGVSHAFASGERQPAPSLAQIPELVASAQANGLDVTLTMDVDPRAVPGPTALTAYRLVAEALANAARHAPGAAIAVDVVRSDAGLQVDIANTPGDLA